MLDGHITYVRTVSWHARAEELEAGRKGTSTWGELVSREYRLACRSRAEAGCGQPDDEDAGIGGEHAHGSDRSSYDQQTREICVFSSNQSNVNRTVHNFLKHDTGPKYADTSNAPIYTWKHTCIRRASSTTYANLPLRTCPTLIRE